MLKGVNIVCGCVFVSSFLIPEAYYILSCLVFQFLQEKAILGHYQHKMKHAVAT